MPVIMITSQKAVSTYFTGKQILHFGFARQYTCIINMNIAIWKYLISVTMFEDDSEETRHIW